MKEGVGMSVVNLDFYKTNYKSRDLDFQVSVEDMINGVLDNVERNLNLFNCSYRWVSDSDISIVRNHNCILDCDDDFLEYLVSFYYSNFIEDLVANEKVPILSLSI